MSEMKGCFRAMGFTQLPTEESLRQRYETRRTAARSHTESDALAARLLEENYRACLRELEEENGRVQ